GPRPRHRARRLARLGRPRRARAPARAAADARLMLRRWLIHPLEALGFGLAMLVLRALPLDWASGLCGAVARAIGPHLPVSRIARATPARALPALDAAAIDAIVRGVWDNLGRVIGEYPHLHRVAATRVEVVGAEHLAPLRDGDAPGLFFSA